MSCDKGEECVALTRERDEALAERDGAQLLVDSLRGNLALMLEGHDHEMADLRAELLKYQTLHHNTETRLHAARADAARLREVLERVRDAMLSTGQAPDGDDDPRRPLATAVWDALDGAARGGR